MIRLILSDLLAHARVWVGALAVTAAAGFAAAIAAGMIETGASYGGEIQEAMSSTSAAVIMFSGVSALIVLNSTANLSVALQSRSYALWQLVGIRPSLVGAVVLVQLGIVGAVGSLGGCLLAIPIFGPLFTWVFREWSQLQGVHTHLGTLSVVGVIAAVTVVVLLGGWRGSRRASRTPPIEALRDPEPPRVRMGWLRWLLTAATLAGTIGLAAAMNSAMNSATADSSLSQISALALFFTPLIASTFAAAGPLLYPLTLRAWTALLPARASTSWFLARNSASYRLSQSSAATGPLMIAIALTGGLYTTALIIGAAIAARTGENPNVGIAPEGVVLMLGGPLLLSGIAAAATVFMSGHASMMPACIV